MDEARVEPSSRAVQITTIGATLPAFLGGPIEPHGSPSGIVVFAHGSGSSRHSPRNQQVASILQQAGFATVLADLLTPEEAARDELTAELRFDVDLLARRVVGIVDWLGSDDVQITSLNSLPIGTFGASTGAAGALMAAAQRPQQVRAVVSRGGRPDLAAQWLAAVTAPTLLIVGGDDPIVLDLNQHAARQLTAPHRLHVVPDAGHLFAEPGALEEVAKQAVDWFVTHLTSETG